jgi:heme-degrading monooxygenase HmoA
VDDACVKSTADPPGTVIATSKAGGRGASLFARATILEGASEEDTKKVINAQVLPAARQIPGFRGLISLVDHEGGTGMTLTLWESEEAMRASEEAANRIRSEAVEAVEPAARPRVERYEVSVFELEGQG